jgi:hypothetical protein
LSLQCVANNIGYTSGVPIFTTYYTCLKDNSSMVRVPPNAPNSNLQTIHKSMETTKYFNYSSRSCWINAKCSNDDDGCLHKGHKREENPNPQLHEWNNDLLSHSSNVTYTTLPTTSIHWGGMNDPTRIWQVVWHSFFILQWLCDIWKKMCHIMPKTSYYTQHFVFYPKFSCFVWTIHILHIFMWWHWSFARNYKIFLKTFMVCLFFFQGLHKK